MKFLAYAFLFLLLACQGPDGLPVSTDDVRKTPKVVFVIVDGIPADLIEKTTTPYIDDISGEKGYNRAFVGGEIGGESESPTLSSVSYNSLLTGTWANKHKVWTNDIKAPDYDYWDIFRIAKAHDPSLKTALFSSWLENRTKLLGDGLEQAGGVKLDYYADGFEHDLERFPHDPLSTYISDIDELVSNEAAKYIKSNGPDLSWVYLEYTDDVGHRYGDSQNLTDAIEVMDARVGKVWTAITERQRAYDEDWLLIVTTDHGRDPDTGHSHGGHTERERTTWIATNSSRLNQNFANSPGIVDILPTIATFLELSMPAEIQRELDGKSFID